MASIRTNFRVEITARNLPAMVVRQVGATIRLPQTISNPPQVIMEPLATRPARRRTRMILQVTKAHQMAETKRQVAIMVSLATVVKVKALLVTLEGSS